jgi:hypothetical protein
MAIHSLDKFKAEVRTRGLAKPNRFEVNILVPPSIASSELGPYSLTSENSRLVSLFCESANLPTQTINVKQQRIIGPAYQRPVGTDYGGEGISMTFLVDQQMEVKAFFDSWMAKIVNPNQYYVSYQSEYAASIKIDQLDEKNNITYAVELIEAFPRSVAMMELNNSTQNQVHKLNVTFAYRKWIAAKMSSGIILPGSNNRRPVTTILTQQERNEFNNGLSRRGPLTTEERKAWNSGK